MIDSQRLRTFRAVVASGSINAAAGNLGYTPSAVSQQVATLARETGLTLVEKSGRGIVPTPDGLALVELSAEVIHAQARLESAVADLRSGASAPLRVGYFPSAGTAWIPPMAHRLAAERPGLALELSLSEGLGHEASATLDLNLLPEHIGQSSTPPPGFTRHPLVDEPYVLAVPANDPLAQRDSVRMDELGDERWIDPSFNETGPCRSILLAAYSAAGITPRWVAQAEDHFTALAFVAGGMGITALPRIAAAAAPAGVTVVELTDPTPTRRVVAHLRGGLPDDVGSRVVELLREVASPDGVARRGAAPSETSGDWATLGHPTKEDADVPVHGPRGRGRDRAAAGGRRRTAPASRG